MELIDKLLEIIHIYGYKCKESWKYQEKYMNLWILYWIKYIFKIINERNLGNTKKNI